MKGCPKDVQESIMSDIYYLHSSYSENEFQVRLTETDRVPGAALVWTFFEDPIALKMKQGIKILNVSDEEKNKICVTALYKL
jgi:hypothetical protein